MKKFLLLVASVAMAMTAGAYEFCYRGTPINDGDRINITSYWDQSMTYFNPELTLKSDTGGTASVTVNNLVSTQSPGLELDEDGFDEITGIGDPTVSWCSFGNCVALMPGQTLTRGGALTPGEELDLLIELAYKLGLDETSIDNMTISASFDVSVTVDGDTKKVTFYVEHNTGAVAGIDADNNAPVQYFDLQGRTVTEPANGIFIKRQGSKVTKVVL
ncbi:MAG: hypothetical protein NC217_05610 [Muribaculaceae bacterium]|nr:hypothetical protein [Muribaculaceae bacterium]